MKSFTSHLDEAAKTSAQYESELTKLRSTIIKLKKEIKKLKNKSASTAVHSMAHWNRSTR